MLKVKRSRDLGVRFYGAGSTESTTFPSNSELYNTTDNPETVESWMSFFSQAKSQQQTNKHTMHHRSTGSQPLTLSESTLGSLDFKLLVFGKLRKL